MGPAWGFVSWVLCGRPGVLRPLPAVRSRISAVVSHCRTLCALLFVTCETVSVRETAFPGGNHDTKSGWTLRGGGLPTTESCITSEIHATRITDRTHSLSDGSHTSTRPTTWYFARYVATSHSHAHVSRVNTTARRESPQPMPCGSSMPRTESARVHMQGAGRVRRCSLVAPRAPLILT
jgi:hypothetical protein